MVGLTMNTNTQAVSTETLLQLVADPWRRRILDHLRENGDCAVTLDELHETVAADGGEQTPHHTAEDPVLIELQHTHLPKLAETGVIEYDRHRRTVRYRSNERVEALVQFVSTRLEQ